MSLTTVRAETVEAFLAQLAARVSGYHVAFLAAAIMLAAGAVLMTFALRKSHTREIERELATGQVAAVPI